MGKKDKKKRQSGLHTPIGKHEHVGKSLVPPLATLTSEYSSWRDDHAPEMGSHSPSSGSQRSTV